MSLCDALDEDANSELFIGASVSQPFPSHGPRELVTKTPRLTKDIFFADLTKKIGIILIYSQQMAVAVSAVVTFLFDSLRETGSLPLT